MYSAVSNAYSIPTTTGRSSYSNSTTYSARPLSTLKPTQSNLVTGQYSSTRSSGPVDLDIPMPALFDMDDLLDFDSNSSSAGEGSLSLESSVKGSTPPTYEDVMDFFIDHDSSSALSDTATREFFPSSPTLSTSSAGSPVMSQTSFGSGSPLTLGRKTSTAPSHGVDKALTKRERNRLAAERCRARKANLINSLQSECDGLRAEREALLRENQILRELLSKLPR